jgi:hypothetical protein
MRSICLFVLMAMTFLSCAPKSNPVTVEQSAAPSFGIVFGREVAPDGWYHYFEPFPYQDTVSIPYLGNLVQLGFKVAEYGLPDSLYQYDALFTNSRALIKVSTRHDQESFQGSVNAVCRGIGRGDDLRNSPNGVSVEFELLVPASIDTMIVQHDNVLELSGKEDDIIVVQYRSSYSGRVFADTLFITKY